MNHEMESEKELAGKLGSHGDVAGGVGGPPGKCDNPTLRVRTLKEASNDASKEEVR